MQNEKIDIDSDVIQGYTTITSFDKFDEIEIQMRAVHESVRLQNRYNKLLTPETWPT